MTSKKLRSFKTSIFTEMSALTKEYNAINLSQGFPNFEGPAELKDVFIDEIRNGWNQYSISIGDPLLRESLSEYYQKNYQLSYQPNSEITITHGATEGLFNSIVGLFDQGDEIIIFEPFYDAYPADISVSGAKAVAVPLLTTDYGIDFEKLLEAINTKTKAIILNSPHNPTGKIFSNEDLTELAKISIENNLIVISDEVYEHIYYDNFSHQSIAQIDGMKERTLIVSSMGKSFSFTGWKVGWVLGPEHLTNAVRACHQFTTFSTNPAGQKAANHALNLDLSYFDELREMYTRKRDLLFSGLENIGFSIFKPNGTYFFLADYSKLSDKNDVDFAKYLTKDVQVAVIPPSSFYLNPIDIKLARFCFAKTDDILYAALDNLSKHFRS
jgi:L-glutamine---4-(methylsulfanyl)-2-oxobutanoate aminotransferase